MIRFIKYATEEQYLAATKNENNFYYVGGNKLYLGTKELTTKDDVTAAVNLINDESKGNEALYTELETLVGSGTGSISQMIAAAKAEVVNNISANNNGIIIKGTQTDKTIGIKLSPKNDNRLDIINEEGEEGLYVTIPEQIDYTVSIDTTAGGSGESYSKRYTVKQGPIGSQATIATIDIPKDMVVEDGFVVDIIFKESDNTLHEGSIEGQDVTIAIKGIGVIPTAEDAGKYIKLIIANTNSSVLYIFAKDLVDVYTAEMRATQVQLAISPSNVISATIVAGSIGTVELNNEVISSLEKANSAIQIINEGNSNGTINVDGTDINVHGLNSAAYARISDFDAAGSASEVLGTISDTAASNTVYGAKAYADEILSWKTLD